MNASNKSSKSSKPLFYGDDTFIQFAIEFFATNEENRCIYALSAKNDEDSNNIIEACEAIEKLAGGYNANMHKKFYDRIYAHIKKIMNGLPEEMQKEVENAYLAWRTPSVSRTSYESHSSRVARVPGESDEGKQPKKSILKNVRIGPIFTHEIPNNNDDRDDRAHRDGSDYSEGSDDESHDHDYCDESDGSDDEKTAVVESGNNSHGPPSYVPIVPTHAATTATTATTVVNSGNNSNGFPGYVPVVPTHAAPTAPIQEKKVRETKEQPLVQEPVQEPAVIVVNDEIAEMDVILSNFNALQAFLDASVKCKFLNYYNSWNMSANSSIACRREIFNKIQALMNKK